MIPSNFEIFGFSHLAALIITGAAALILIRAALRLKSELINKRISYFIVFLITGGLALMILYKAFMGTFSVHIDLPMQLCDWAGLMIVATIFFRGQLTFELAYFWVLSGSTQALLTPDIVSNFPSVEFTYFFMVHSGEIIGIFFLIFIFEMSPEKWSVIRAFAFTNVYLLCAFLVNWSTKSNYGYILKKPPGGSLMDYLGPWPYYILSLLLVALASYIICYSPYYFMRLKKNRSRT